MITAPLPLLCLRFYDSHGQSPKRSEYSGLIFVERLCVQASSVRRRQVLTHVAVS